MRRKAAAPIAIKAAAPNVSRNARDRIFSRPPWTLGLRPKRNQSTISATCSRRDVAAARDHSGADRCRQAELLSFLARFRFRPGASAFLAPLAVLDNRSLTESEVRGQKFEVRSPKSG